MTPRTYAILDKHAPEVGGPIFAKWNYQTSMKTACKKLGFGKVHLRALRHAAITDARRKGADPHAAQALAGHANISTQDRYTHTALDDARRALNVRNVGNGTPTGTPTETEATETGPRLVADPNDSQ